MQTSRALGCWHPMHFCCASKSQSLRNFRVTRRRNSCNAAAFENFRRHGSQK